MTNTATLHNGTVVPTDSQEWRAECEAAAVLRKGSKLARHVYLDNVEKHRGKDARKALEARIWDLWQARRRAKDEKAREGIALRA